MAYRKQLTAEQALQKARHYCAYQERCHREVREKLYALGLHKQDVEICLSRLIEEDYLNEERFAIQFAGGKFRINHWGRVKISHYLKQKQVSPYCIKKALNSLDETEYLKALEKEAEKKWQNLNGRNRLEKLSKTTAFLLQKGYEPELARKVLNKFP